MLKSLVVAALLAGLPGCGLQDFYGKEYTLYDGAQQDEQKSKTEAGQDGVVDGAAAVDDGAGPIDANSAGPGESEGGESPAVAPDIDRIFVLERVFDELNRAIRDGLEPSHVLIQKRKDVEDELTWRRRAAGAGYLEARKARVEALTQFATRPENGG